jgi:hypothetical protein
VLGVFGLGGSASKRRRPSLDGGLVRERPFTAGYARGRIARRIPRPFARA